MRGAALVLLFALFALPVLLAPVNFPSDDSLFYLQVARNIAAGHGSTFNTVTPTNGYHPLWMGPCIVAAWFSGGEPVRMLRTVFVMQMLLAAGCLLAFRAVARRLGIGAWPLGVPVLATFFLTGMYGSEAHLNALCLLVSLLFLLRVQAQPRASDTAFLGVFLGLTVLARLDNVFLAVAMLAGITIWARNRHAATAIRIAFAASALVLPYLAWNFVAFGSIVPISGTIKSTFPKVVGDLRNLGGLGLMTFVAALLGMGWVLLRQHGDGRRLALGTMTVGVLAQSLYIVLFTSHNTHWSWYYVSGVLLATFLLCSVVDAAGTRIALLRSRAVVILSIAALTTLGLARGWARFLNSSASSHSQFVLRFLPPSEEERWEIQFARFMEHVLPAKAGVLVFDYPGHFAFYSSLRVVPADGLIGDFRYDSDLRREGLRTFLFRHAIAYYVGSDLAPPDSCRTETIFAPVGRVDVGSLTLCPGNRLAATSTIVEGAPGPDVALFRIEQVGAARGTPPSPVRRQGTIW